MCCVKTRHSSVDEAEEEAQKVDLSVKKDDCITESAVADRSKETASINDKQPDGDVSGDENLPVQKVECAVGSVLETENIRQEDDIVQCSGVDENQVIVDVPAPDQEADTESVANDMKCGSFSENTALPVVQTSDDLQNKEEDVAEDPVVLCKFASLVERLERLADLLEMKDVNVESQDVSLLRGIVNEMSLLYAK